MTYFLVWSLMYTIQAFKAVPAPTQVSAVSVLATHCASDSMLMLVKSLLYSHTLVTFPVCSKGDNIDITYTKWQFQNT